MLVGAAFTRSEWEVIYACVSGSRESASTYPASNATQLRKLDVLLRELYPLTEMGAPTMAGAGERHPLDPNGKLRKCDATDCNDGVPRSFLDVAPTACPLWLAPRRMKRSDFYSAATT